MGEILTVHLGINVFFFHFDLERDVDPGHPYHLTQAYFALVPCVFAGFDLTIRFQFLCDR